MLRSCGWLLALCLAGCSNAAKAQSGRDQGAHDWPVFGGNVESTSASSFPTGINAGNVGSLARRQVNLDGAVDASAIYLHDVTVKGAKHDVFFVTTTYGKTIAIDAASGGILWEYTPAKYTTWAATVQFTTSTPVADPNRAYIYAAAPDGTVQKLAVADGHPVWTTAVTLLPQREKIASPLKLFRGRIIAVTGGYIGDQPPYQGHIAILDSRSGALLHVWNSLCSDRTGLIDPSSCSSTRSAIWGRAGAVVDPGTGNIFVATGNGPYNGTTDWGDSIIELDSDATRVLGNFTTTDNSQLDNEDLDLGSTSPVLLGGGMLAQGGKDSIIRLVGMGAISGAAQHTDHELQTVATPSGNMLFTAPAVWHTGGDTWLFAADNGGTAAWKLSSGKLVEIWKNSTPGTSPVVADGLLYVYDPQGGLFVYNAAGGKQIARLDAGGGHWNSPIVVDGRIALPEGDANQRPTTGVLDIWSLPAQ
jgi:PQQ-like domain